MDVLFEHAGAIGIAVITALLTTIIVEYLAKPRLAALAQDGQYISDGQIRQIAMDMPAFDTYFVANIDFRDSQVPAIKRWFWKRFTSKSYRNEAVAIMDAQHGGSQTNTPDVSVST